MASASPLAAAFSYHSRALAESCATPDRCVKHAEVGMALASPLAAAFSNHSRALA